jgi:hypothetical protein
MMEKVTKLTELKRSPLPPPLVFQARGRTPNQSSTDLQMLPRPTILRRRSCPYLRIALVEPRPNESREQEDR